MNSYFSTTNIPKQLSFLKHMQLVLAALCLGMLTLLVACGKQSSDANTSSQAAPQVSAQSAALRILAGSELKELQPAMQEAAQEAGVPIHMEYAGVLDMVERVNAGEAFDAILPANGAYAQLALAQKPAAREKLFYSRVALGVKTPVAQKLGWLQKNPNWADIAQAAGSGQLRYAMTNPSSSNSGMSALFAVASAVAGKTEGLEAQDVKADVLKNFLKGQKLTAGSSGWLADSYLKDASSVDGIINYEAVLLRLNEKLGADKLAIIYPQDGVISADYPLILLKNDKRAEFDKLVAALKNPAFQNQALQAAYLRPSSAEASLSAALPTQAVAELAFPNRLETIDAVLMNYLSDLRRPSTSIFVMDTSGSMEGDRLAQMKQAITALTQPSAQASARYAAFQNREKVVLLRFSDHVWPSENITIDSKRGNQDVGQIAQYVQKFEADGGTAIYEALAQARRVAQQEAASNPDRFISIVLFTDGENTAGQGFSDFRNGLLTSKSASAVRIFPIVYGEANASEMQQLAELTGGKAFDARKTPLPLIFREIRAYQ